jgi:hypothetical protein
MIGTLGARPWNVPVLAFRIATGVRGPICLSAVARLHGAVKGAS